MSLLIMGRIYKITCAGVVFAATPRLLGCISRLNCRPAGLAQLPVWLERLACPVRWLGSVNLNVSSIRFPGRLLLACNCGCHDSTNLLVGSIRHCGLPAAWHVPAKPLDGSDPLPDWLERLLCRCPNQARKL